MDIRPEIERLIAAIQNDAVHGASELARQSLQVFIRAAEESQFSSSARFKAEQEEIGRRLMSVRPSMVSINNVVNRLLRTVNQDQSRDVEGFKSITIATAENLIQTSSQAVRRIARHTVDLVSPGEVIFTYSYSSTVETALKAVCEKSRIQIIISRSGIGRTGEKMVRNLKECFASLVFIDDTAMGSYVCRAQRVLVGADRICADGALVNGAGTYLLALAAREAGVPFYVLCETLKFDTRLHSSDVILEEKDPSEIVAQGLLPDKVMVLNPYFDLTPLRLITAIVTENGLIYAKDVMYYLTK